VNRTVAVGYCLIGLSLVLIVVLVSARS